MGARCETIGKYVLPAFRALIAEELVHTYGLTQVEAAKRLGTTQAAISQYLNSKRAYKSTNQFNDLRPKIKKMAHETAKRLANKEMNSGDIATDVCKLCTILDDEEESSQTTNDYTI
jgi:predicted transcriptional regulator